VCLSIILVAGVTFFSGGSIPPHPSSIGLPPPGG
jgi:hypothetical protein